MQLIGSLIAKVSVVGISGRASLIEILAIMGGTTAAVFIILRLMKYRKARTAKSRVET